LLIWLQWQLEQQFRYTKSYRERKIFVVYSFNPLKQLIVILRSLLDQSFDDSIAPENKIAQELHPERLGDWYGDLN
jgi:hypothetical protein